MKIFFKYIFVFILLPLFSSSQTDTIGKVKYTTGFVFNDGIYKTFQEFKNNNPSIKKFTAKKSSPYSNPDYILLAYECPDSLKAHDNCQLKDVWGYTYHGDVYIAHSYYSYYFKLMVIGSVCHFVGLSSSIGVNPYNNLTIGLESDESYQQFMLDFETGKINEFNYKIFSAFLKTHDDVLYKELKKQKKKKKIIFKYLLKYNESHPIWFKES